MIDCDIAIVGGGLAGCRAALEVKRRNPDADLVLIAKTHPIRSHSVAAQGGIAATLKNVDDADSWEAHAFDTVKGSDYLADQDAVEILTREAPEVIYDLEHLGVLFSRLADGRIAQRAFGGHSHRRTCYAADKTGHAILHELVSSLFRYGVKVYDEWYVNRLIVEDNQAKGLVMYDIDSGRFEVLRAKAIMFATGGYGRVFNTTSNDYSCTGDGLAMTIRAGLPLQDMEFVQFHPTGLYPVGVLISEAVRGEGAYLLNSEGDRFMATYAPKQMELAPRDITSRAIVSEVRAGRGVGGETFVHLDLRHMGAEKIHSKLPFCWEEAHRHLGIDAVVEPIPVRPTIHYSMGGIPTNTDGQVRNGPDGHVEGFFAAGESACVSVHGANRLGSNALLECVVYGRRTGATLAEYVRGRSLPSFDESRYLAEAECERVRLFEQPGEFRIDAIRRKFQDCMTEYCGVYRTHELMSQGGEQVAALRAQLDNIRLDDRGQRWNTELTEAWELRNLMIVGSAIITGALHRKESRGAHSREEYVSRDDVNFLQHTLAYLRGNEIEIAYRPVKINRFEPKERKY
ncbi:MAG: succinate dehydrogenase/fumarate reductase flavoprotein subunit [Cyanobacteria bacterium P01_D01_bin.123]